MGSQGERARSEPVPGPVTLRLWRVPARRVPAAPVGPAPDRRPVRAPRAFAHAGPHADAVQPTTLERWYAEELFARFAVPRSAGTIDSRDPLG